MFNRATFESVTSSHWNNLYRMIEEAIQQYKQNPNTPNLGAEDIDLIFLTGGHSQWYCVDNLILGKGVNGYIGIDYQGQDGLIHKALDFSKIKKYPTSLIREKLPHETVARGLCLKDTSIEISSFSSNNVWGQLIVNNIASDIFPIFKTTDKLPTTTTISPSVEIKQRLNNQQFDVIFKLYYGDTLQTAVCESSQIKFDGRMVLIDILFSLVGVGFIKNSYKIEAETNVVLEKNGIIDFAGNACVYDMDSKGKLMKQLKFSKGENISTDLY